MRRSDREIKDEKLIEEFIKSEQIIRIAFYDDGDIYIVPVNYGYTFISGKYSFYFHGAKAGRKYNLCKSSPKVGFEIDGKYKLLEDEIACNYSAKFQSVIGNGKIQIIEDIEEKRDALNILMKQVSKNEKWLYDEKILENVVVYKLEVESLTCKAK